MSQTNLRPYQLLFVALTLLVSACGFHLRGNISLPSGIEPIYIQGANDELAAALRTTLNASGLVLTTDIENANHLLVISKQQRQKRNSALGEGARVIEYLLIDSLHFELQDKNGKTLFGPNQLSERKIMENDPNKVVSSQQEESLMREEMLVNLSSKLLRQLRTFRPTNSAAADAN